jgi:hypothetical protein
MHTDWQHVPSAHVDTALLPPSHRIRRRGTRFSACTVIALGVASAREILMQHLVSLGRQATLSLFSGVYIDSVIWVTSANLRSFVVQWQPCPKSHKRLRSHRSIVACNCCWWSRACCSIPREESVPITTATIECRLFSFHSLRMTSSHCVCACMSLLIAICWSRIVN